MNRPGAVVCQMSPVTGLDGAVPVGILKPAPPAADAAVNNGPWNVNVPLGNVPAPTLAAVRPVIVAPVTVSVWPLATVSPRFAVSNPLNTPVVAERPEASVTSPVARLMANGNPRWVPSSARREISKSDPAFAPPSAVAFTLNRQRLLVPV